MKRYWLTPPELEHEREGRWDPCPYPLPEGWDALARSWEKPWYANPPFAHITRFVRKAIQEGGPGTIIFPTNAATYLLIEAGAHLEVAGRIQWIECDTGERMPNPPLCLIARLP